MEKLTDVHITRKPDGEVAVEFSNGRTFKLIDGTLLLKLVARLCLEKQMDEQRPF